MGIVGQILDPFNEDYSGFSHRNKPSELFEQFKDTSVNYETLEKIVRTLFC
jgi:hypothetical protein